MVCGRLGSWWGRVSGAALLGLQLGLQATPAQAQMSQRHIAQTPSDLLMQLDEAVCFNQWDDAIELTGAILARSDVSADYRLSLLNFRAELIELQAFDAVVPNSSSCDRTRALTLSTPTATQANTNPGLDWREGIAAITRGNRQIIQLDPTPNELIDTPIPLALLNASPDAFSAAVPLDTRDGFSVVAGAINPSQHQTYAFVARVGDRVTLDLDVTRIAVDAGITGEDSHLFLFDSAGRLITENDDADGRQSRIDQLVIVETQVYYVVVASHNNLPILDPTNQLAAWTGTGSTRFDYTLTLTGATPSGAILR